MTSRDDGGASERIAPVIPLFGAQHGAIGASNESRDRAETGRDSDGRASRRSVDADLWRSTWGDTSRGTTASVEPFGADSTVGRIGSDDPSSPSDRHPARRGVGGRASGDDRSPRLRALRDDSSSESSTGAAAPTDLREIAEEILVRKLRSRSLSVSEARLVLRGVEHEGAKLDPSIVDDILDVFAGRSYLDDAQLAGQLVAAGVERKGQGRVALSRALAQRGIPREIIDAALDELPDDDAERALEYARSKARSLSRLDSDTALRRLVGQLARRGYNGGIAMSAAKTALAEATFGRPASGVRFVDSD